MASLTHEQLRKAYLQLLGREPEREGLWEDVDAVTALLEIASSHEHRDHIRRQTASEERFQIAAADGLYFLTCSEDRVIGESLRLGGKFEEGSVEAVTKLLAANGRHIKNDVFVDVGANIGTHSIRAIMSGFSRAVCIEADENNFKLLKINQILNNVEKQCINYLLAASYKHSEFTIELSPTNFGDHRIRLNSAAQSFHGEENWETNKILGMELDSILSDALSDGKQPSLVWVDTQGHEAHVLSGASKLLSSNTPIVIEFWPYGLYRSGGLIYC